MAMVAMLLLLCCGKQPEEGQNILPENCQLRVGDLVFRRGAGLTSHAVLLAEGGGGYSHVGIVVDSMGTLVVVHAVPGETAIETDTDRVKMDLPEAFFLKVRASNGVVLRHRDSLIAARAAANAFRLYERGVLFDHDYDDLDTTKMYCTEFVSHVYASVVSPIVGQKRHHFKFFHVDTHCILPSDLFECSNLEMIYQF